MFRPLTLDEIAEVLHAEDDPGDIILFPPEDGEITDEDIGDKNDTNILHLPSRMLRSQVELQNRPSVSGEQDHLQDLEEEEEEEAGPAPKKKKKKENTVKKWFSSVSSFTTCGKGDRDEEIFNHCQEVMTPIECFELMYSDSIVNFIVEMTNL